jgi:hypothetical protein
MKLLSITWLGVSHGFVLYGHVASSHASALLASSPGSALRSPAVCAGAKDLSRREVISANSWYKSFVKAGGGEALLFVIAGATALYGGSVRGSLFDDLKELEAGGRNQGVAHVPIVRISPSGANGRVRVEISASGVAAPDSIDCIWVRDERTGEIIGARSFRSTESPVLGLLAVRGQSLVPLVHSQVDGVWEGTPFVAALP